MSPDTNSSPSTDSAPGDDALRFETILLKAQLETSLDAILVVDESGEILSYNRRFIDMWGLPPEVVSSRSDEDAIRHVLDQVADPDAFVARITELYGQFDATSRDEIGLRDGRVFERYSAPVRDSEGRYHARIWFFRDVTERKKFEEALRRSEERFRSVVESSSDLVTLMDGNGSVFYQSPAIVRMFGYDEQELIGQNALDYIHPDDLPEVAVKLGEVAAHPGETRSAAFRFRHKDGHWVHVEAVGSTLSPTDAAEGVVVNTRDITERKEAELALRKTTRFLENLIASSPGVIFRASGEPLKTTYISPNAEAVLGFPVERFLADPEFWAERVHPEDHDAFIAKLRRATEEKALALTYEYRFLHADGSYRNLLASVRFERDPNTAAVEVLGYTLDVSPLKEAEAALRRAKEEAESANRAKSEFLSRMSHELRTPMNSILGFAQILGMGELAANQRRAVDRIRNAGEHLLNLINEVLDLSRIESGRQSFSIEPVRVSTVLKEALNLIRPLATQRGCRLAEDVPDEAEGFVCADRQRLTQVFLNLLSNAVKYNRPGGEVSVHGELPGDEYAGTLRIGIRDTGPGIPAERMKDLFTPFSRLGAETSEVEGTGLGLALSRTLVEAMGGRIFAESVVGDGSTFWVELPVARDPRDVAEPAGAERETDLRNRVASHPVTILYIEDNQGNLALLEELFSTYPEITLHSALQGRLGIELATEHTPDLILLDLHLPDIPGAEVLRRLQADARTRSIPVIVVSADATERQIERLHAAGARAYLTKPLDLDQLLAAISSALGAGTSATPAS